MEGRKMDLLGCRSHNNMKDGVASPSRRPFDPTRSQEKSLKSLREEIKSQKTELGNLETKDLFICTRKVHIDFVKDLDYDFEQITNLVNKIRGLRDDERIKCEKFKEELNSFLEGRLKNDRFSLDNFHNNLKHLYSFAEIATDEALKANKAIYRKVLNIWNYMKINKMDDFDKKKFQDKHIVMNDGTVIEVKALIALGKQVRKISQAHKRIIGKMETWEIAEEKSKFTNFFKKEPLAKELIDSFESERQQFLMLIEACKPKERVNDPKPSTSGDQGNDPKPSTSGDQGNDPKPSTSGDQGVNNSKQSNSGDKRVNNSKQSNPGEQPIVCEAVNHLNNLLCELSPSIQDSEYVQHLYEASHAQQAVWTEIKDFNPRLKAHAELNARKETLEQDITKSENLEMCLNGYLENLTSYQEILRVEIEQNRSAPKDPLPLDILIRNEVSYKQKRRILQRHGQSILQRHGQRENSSRDREEQVRTPQRRESGSSRDREEQVRTPQKGESGSPEIVEGWVKAAQKNGKGLSQDGEESNRIPLKKGKAFQQAGIEEGAID